MKVLVNEIYKICIPVKYIGVKFGSVRTELQMCTEFSAHSLYSAIKNIFGFEPSKTEHIDLDLLYETSKMRILGIEPNEYKDPIFCLVITVSSTTYYKYSIGSKLEKFLEAINEHLAKWQLGSLEAIE